MWLEKLAPQKFLLRFSLRKGAIVIGIIMLCICIICVISLTVEIVYYKECVGCTLSVMHNAYSFSINALIYCIFMICINVWFLWGVKKRKSSVVLSWVVITTMWWAQSSILVFVLLCMYITNNAIGWMVALGCAILASMIFAYFILVVYGYWLQIRKTATTTITATIQ